MLKNILYKQKLKRLYRPQLKKEIHSLKVDEIGFANLYLAKINAKQFLVNSDASDEEYENQKEEFYNDKDNSFLNGIILFLQKEKILSSEIFNNCREIINRLFFDKNFLTKDRCVLINKIKELLRNQEIDSTLFYYIELLTFERVSLFDTPDKDILSFRSNWYMKEYSNFIYSILYDTDDEFYAFLKYDKKNLDEIYDSHDEPNIKKNVLIGNIEHILALVNHLIADEYQLLKIDIVRERINNILAIQYEILNERDNDDIFNLKMETAHVYKYNKYIANIIKKI